MTKGDPITLVFLGHVELREVLLASDELDYVLVGPHRLLVVDEGVTWVKGWHKPDHAFVSAARTCQVLREKEGAQVPIFTPNVGGGIGLPNVPLQAPPFPLGPGVPFLPSQPYIGDAPSWITVTSSSTKG